VKHQVNPACFVYKSGDKFDVLLDRNAALRSAARAASQSLQTTSAQSEVTFDFDALRPQ